MSDTDQGQVEGLPEPLPAGERIITQARPCWRSLAIHAFHARKIAVYCLAILAWRIGSALAAGRGVGAAFADGAAVAPIALAGMALPLLLAWAYARTSIYTITDRRLVLRAGVALPMTFNLPYSQIKSAALRLYADGTGDIPVHLAGDTRLAFAHLWPYVRPWRINHPEPMLRAVADARAVGQALAHALAAAHGVAPIPAGSGAPLRAMEQLETAAA